MHRLICAVGLCLCLPVRAAQLVLELEDGVTRSWDSEQLLLHAELRMLDIPNDVAYRRSMSYKALPLAVLLNDVSPDVHLQVEGLDGFSAEFTAAPLLARDGTSAWIAVEDPSERWPQLPGKQGSAGPFYLVWIDADPQVIGPEQWPYQITRIRLVPKVVERFPTLRPADNATPDVHKGFVQFQKHCLSCHRLNEGGDARIGPDLNLPHNPTEYFAGDFLRRYIRNPQSVRLWPESTMQGFGETVLNDRQLDDLIAYLRHMAGRKATTPLELTRSEAR